MRKRTIAILAAAALLVAGGIFTFAQRAMHRGGPGMRGGAGVTMALKALDLTDDQKSKVKEIFEANKGTIRPLREQIKANREKLAAMKGNFDEAEVSAIAKEQGQLISQMVVARQRVKSQIFAILTEEQKAKAEQMRATMKSRFDKRKEFFRGGDQQKTDE